MLVENSGNGKFNKHNLSAEAQFALVNSIEVSDFNKDGFVDLVLAGNEYHLEVDIYPLV